MGYEAVDVFVKDTTPEKKPVQGVVVKVFSEDGKIAYGLQQTDVDGHAAFLLPSEFKYSVRFYKFGYSFDQPQLLEVLDTPEPPQTNVFDAVATSVAPPIPNDVRLCTAYGYFRDVTGAPAARTEIHLIGKFQPVWLEGAGVVKERVIIRTDDKGYTQVNLIRNAQYDCVIQGEEDIVRHISVPDAPNVNLPDLIFPVVERVVTDPPGPFTLSVGQELVVGLHVMSSDGRDLGRALGDVHYYPSGPDVANISFDDAHIILRGHAPGTMQVEIKRADNSIVRIPDAGILGQPLVVNVVP